MIVNVFKYNFDTDSIPELNELVRHESISVLCNRHSDLDINYYLYTSLVQLEHDIIVIASDLSKRPNNYLKKQSLSQKIDSYNKLIHEFFITNFKELILNDE